MSRRSVHGFPGGMAIRSRTKAAAGLLAATVSLAVLLAGAGGAAAVTGPTFWKVDLHEHSAFSGDARADVGIDAAVAQSRGYNAVFLTDHDRMSGFQIQGANGNFLSYTDKLSGRWTAKSAPTPLPVGSAATNEVSSTHVHSGSSSLHLAATAGTSTNVRSYVYADRGVGLLSGNPTLDFWVYPQTIDAGSGVDVSVSLGGDKSTGVSTYGYSTADGTPHIGKSTVLVWQLGSARAASADGTTDVYTNALHFTPATWNHYTIDLLTGAGSWTPTGGSPTAFSSTGVNALGLDQPASYDVLAYVKMEASAVNGTADAYFDDYTMRVPSPQCPAAEFVTRDNLIDSGQFNTSSFKLFPAREMGQNNHSNQFNFDVTSATRYKDTYNDTSVPQNDATLCASTNSSWVPPWQFNYYGSDNIPDVQASGYPAQDNHPGVTDTTNDVVTTLAHGADTVEVRTSADYSSTWDAILQQNHPVIGTYGSDAHTGVSNGAPASYIDAPTLGLNDLLHSLFEGRLFMAPNTFGGTIDFNLDGGPSPYPARYPVYVPATQTTASVHLSISGGLTSGEHVVWYYSSGGADQTITDTISGSTYGATKAIPLSGSFTYVRAAVTSSGGTLVANTEPIFFEDVSGLPSGTSVHVDTFTPPTGTCSCTVGMMKGITSAAYTNSALALTLTDPVGTTTTLVGSSAAPSSVTMDGTPITPSSSLSAFESAIGDAYFYDGSTRTLYLQDDQTAGATSTIAVALASGSNAPPTANDVSSSAVSGALSSWVPSVSDPDAGDTLTCSIVSPPSHGTASVSSDCSGGTYTSSSGYVGPDSLTYKVNDGHADSSPGTVSVTVSAGSGGGGVVSLVQQATAAGRAASLAVSLPTASTSGDALVATVGLAAGSSASVTGITDSGGGNWTKGPVGFQSGTNSRVELWYRVGASSVSGVTVTLSVAKPASVSVSEWAGVAAASALDGSAQGGTASSSTVGTPSLVTSNASDLVIGAVNYPVAATSTLTSSAFASLDDFSYSTSVHGRVAYAVTSAAGSYGVAWSLSAASGGSGGAILALKAAAGGGSSDTESPTVPQNLTAAAMGGSEIDLSWDASTDSGGSGLVGYNVYRDGTRVASVTPGTKTSYADTGLSPSTTHTYRVSAVDSATNESAQSAPASATTGGAGGGGVTLAPVADAYVNAGAATTNYGKATTLRVDASPATTSFLRFNVQGVSGSVSSVVLKVWANSSLSAGYSVNVVADDTWGESTVTSATAPAIGASVGSSGPVSSGGYTSITLTPSSVVGNGDVDFALVGLSSTALALASRESANPPLLIVNGS